MSNDTNYNFILYTIAGAGITYYTYKMYNKYTHMMDKINQIKIVNKKNDIIIHNKYIEIKYTYMNENYTLRVPYDKTKIATMVNYNVFSNKGNEMFDITQQPGIPYLVSANDLDVDGISVFNLDTENIDTYINTAPMYFNVKE